MITKIKDATIFTITKEWLPSSLEMEIVKGATDLYMRIVISCLFGKHDKDCLVKQIKDGVEIHEPAGLAMQKVIEETMSR